MAKKMTAAKMLREKSASELADHALELQRQLFDLNFQHATRQLEDTASLKKTRRELARTYSIIGEKQLEA